MIELETAVKNIQAVLDAATSEERRSGPDWYEVARQQCEAMAVEHNLPLATVVAVVAALSPNNKWQRNVADAATLIKAYLGGHDILSVKVCTYHTMRAKAWDILASRAVTNEELIKQLNGRKIVSFFRNIMGDRASVTIDGHARNIAYAERLSLTGSKFTIGVREYRLLSEAYSEVGIVNGLKAYEVQAITWMAWRRMHGIK